MEFIDKSISRHAGEVFAGLVILSLALTGRAAERPSGMTLTFGTGQVTVGGVVGRHQVIAFGIGIGVRGYTPLLTRNVKASRDDDGDGIIAFPARSLTPRSVWAAVDFETGDYVVGTPTGEMPRPLNFPADSWRGNRVDLDIHRAYLEVLVVRRRVGAWTLRAADGGSNDADATSNAVLKLRLDKMEKLIGEEKGPPFAVAKDLIIVVDPQNLDTFVSEAR